MIRRSGTRRWLTAVGMTAALARTAAAAEPRPHPVRGAADAAGRMPGGAESRGASAHRRSDVQPVMGVHPSAAGRRRTEVRTSSVGYSAGETSPLGTGTRTLPPARVTRAESTVRETSAIDEAGPLTAPRERADDEPRSVRDTTTSVATAAAREVPEPATAGLVGAGFVLLLLAHARERRSPTC